MKKFFFLSAITVFVLLSFSCKTVEHAVVQKKEPVSKMYYGKARIVDIKPSGGDGEHANRLYMDILFDFIPSDTEAIRKYQFPESGDSGILLFYDNRNNFHRNWIEKWGIKTGNEYPAVRHESAGMTTGPHVSYEVDLKPAQ